MRKLVGLFAGAAILVAACGGTSTTPAPSADAPSTPAESQPAESAAPSESAAAGPIDLFGSDYAPEEGAAGGEFSLNSLEFVAPTGPVSIRNSDAKSLELEGRLEHLPSQ